MKMIEEFSKYTWFQKSFFILAVIGLIFYGLLHSSLIKLPDGQTILANPKPQEQINANSEQLNPEITPIYLTMDPDMSRSMAAKVKTGQVKHWYDPQVFDYLIQNQIPATFFVSGLFVETYPDLIRRLGQNKIFSFQNHSYDESGFTPNCYGLNILKTDQEKIDQIKKTQEIITQFTGQVPTLFRFPGICHSPHDDSLVESLGFKIDNGSVSAGDAFNSNANAIINKIMSNMSNMKPGSVILMHVGGPNAPKSFEVLKTIVPKLRNLGYTFSTE